ncbi:hypothetical protein [Cytobacillus purgationiresistens]|uniref:Uncharacterized protein n=1 Tax=Cytobacillus purgationiresistens TaxID=863449 RepID=A0ABU0AKA5_9BACI|nr:hypothetical protein [Cytobacillus purgationiresistens]MDQ0271704.1 hypothetical protein [Cytobacillus purgationiresistens]
MEVNPQTSHKIKIVTKKETKTRTFLNIYGVFACIGLVLSIFTVPISISENMEFIRDEELLMETNKIKGFLTFIISSAVLYFSLVNLYYIRKK